MQLPGFLANIPLPALGAVVLVGILEIVLSWILDLGPKIRALVGTWPTWQKLVFWPLYIVLMLPGLAVGLALCIAIPVTIVGLPIGLAAFLERSTGLSAWLWAALLLIAAGLLAMALRTVRGALWRRPASADWTRSTEFTSSEARSKMHRRVQVTQSNAVVSAGTTGTVVRTTDDNKVIVAWERPPTPVERFAYDGQWYTGYQDQPETQFDKSQYNRWLREL
jgi:hypothetical protein